MSSDGLVLTVFQWSKLGFERFIATGHSGGMGECGGTSGKGTVVADKRWTGSELWRMKKGRRQRSEGSQRRGRGRRARKKAYQR
jgi:hypothetical protein